MSNRLIIPEHDLPDWIRRAKRGLDWGIVIVLVLSVAIGWSFFVSKGLSSTNASENYAFRVANVATALKQGELFPRWTPNAIYGYGAPILHYYPPLPSFIPAALTTLLTSNIPDAIRLTFLIAFAGAGTATYSLALRHGGAKAGILAALIYVYSPFAAYLLPHQYGDLGGMLVLALLPAWLWSLDRTLGKAGWHDPLMLAIFTACLLLSDPITTPFSMLLLGTALCGYDRLRRFRATGWTILLSLLCGIGLAAPYWLPALAELNAVNWDRLDASLQPSVTLANLLRGFVGVDPLVLQGIPQLSLGLAMVIGLALSIAQFVWARRTNFYSAFLLTTILILFFAMSLNVSSWIGAAMLAGAVTVSGLPSFFHDSRLSRQLCVALIALVIVLSTPLWTSQQVITTTASYTSLDEIRYEQLGYGIATLPQGAPVPSNISLSALPDGQLLEGYQIGNVNRLRAAITTRDQVALLSDQTQSQRYNILLLSSLPTTFTINPFAGWQATLGGRDLPLLPSSREGGYDLVVPPTSADDLVIALGPTPSRQLAWGVAVFAAFTTFLMSMLRRQQRTIWSNLYPPLLSTGDIRLLGIAIASCAFLGLIADSGTFNRPIRPQPASGLQNATLVTYRTNTPLQLIGYELDNPSVSLGSSLHIRLYWQTSRPLEVNYKAVVTLNNVEMGGSSTNQQSLLLGGYPSIRWATDRYVLDNHTLTVPNDISVGRYTLTIKVVPCSNRNQDCDLSRPIQFFGTSGDLIGTLLTIPRIVTVNP